MQNKEPRIPYIKRDEWVDGTSDMFAIMGRSEEEKEEARKNGSKMNMLNVLAHYPNVSIPYLEIGKALFQINLSLRLREIAVLRLAHLSNSEYEWFQHVAIGKHAGLTDADIEAIKVGQPRDDWSEIDGLMIEVVNELEEINSISDDLWERMSHHFDRQQMFEFIFMISSYKMTAWVLNSINIPLDDMPQGKPPV